MAFELAKQKNCEITGISLSKNQINYCKNKAKELGLDNQVKFELVEVAENPPVVVSVMESVVSSVTLEVSSMIT